MALAIEAQELSKRYRIGQMQAAYGTLRDSLARTAARLTGGADSLERQEIWALRDVSFSVREGEVLGVIGRSGRHVCIAATPINHRRYVSLRKKAIAAAEHGSARREAETAARYQSRRPWSRGQRRQIRQRSEGNDDV